MNVCYFNRHIIAAVHFNLNLYRENKRNEDGTAQIKLVYPKFENGEATVRDQKVKPEYGKIITSVCQLINTDSNSIKRKYFFY